jgi:mRNA interferase YafQ
LLRIGYTNKFKKDFNKQKKNLSFEDLEKFYDVIRKLKNNEMLEESFQDHKLNDDKNYKDCRDCHIKPDLVLIYHIDEMRQELILMRINSHSEIGI